MDDLPPELLPDVGPKKRRLSGGERRIESNQLPQSFFLYCWDRSKVNTARAVIIGLVTIERMLFLGQGLHEGHIEHQRSVTQLSDHADVLLWKIQRFYPCPEFQLPASAAASWDRCTHLKMSAALVALLRTFGEGQVPLPLQKRPRALKVALPLSTWFAQEKPEFLVTHTSYLNAAGLQPPKDTHTKEYNRRC
jgi:hypothetical protein